MSMFNMNTIRNALFEFYDVVIVKSEKYTKKPDLF